MRLTPQPDNIDTLDAAVLRRFRKKLLKNYNYWCSYLGKKSNAWIPDSRRSGDLDLRQELLYVSLYLLIWGEAANLQFASECICYIFHNMAYELNRIMVDFIDENTGQLVMPSTSGENACLNFVVKPIYETISPEVDNSRIGTAPHSAWRHYDDDINEYFLSRRCFEKLRWPPDVGTGKLRLVTIKCKYNNAYQMNEASMKNEMLFCLELQMSEPSMEKKILLFGREMRTILFVLILSRLLAAQ